MKKVKNDVLERFEDFSRNFKSNFKSIPGGIDNIARKHQLAQDFLNNEFDTFGKQVLSKYQVDSKEWETVNETLVSIVIKIQNMAITE